MKRDECIELASYFEEPIAELRSKGKLHFLILNTDVVTAVKEVWWEKEMNPLAKVFLGSILYPHPYLNEHEVIVCNEKISAARVKSALNYCMKKQKPWPPIIERIFNGDSSSPF